MILPSRTLSGGSRLHRPATIPMMRLSILPLLVFVFAFACAAAAGAASPSASSSCSDLADLRRRVSLSLSPSTGRPTPELSSLRGVVDDVLSRSECERLVNLLEPRHFVSGGGYDSSNSGYTAPSGYAGLGLRELSRSSSSEDSRPILTKDEYDQILEWRERARSAAERALGLCPGTLRVDFTTISQKTPGGSHRPHADNAYHKFIPVPGDTSQTTTVAVDPSRGAHPFPNRIAASILYLNDGGEYDGGEFYFARHSDGKPDVKVEPKAGRMAVFTAGVENLHGALPVREPEEKGRGCQNGGNDGGGEGEGKGKCPPTRRLALAMWYVPDAKDEEKVPAYGSSPSAAEEEDPNVHPLFELPVKSIKRGGLRLALSLHLLGKQNTPSQGSWKFVGSNDEEKTGGIELGMVFQDGTGMVSISLGDRSIKVGRHTDGPNQRPSLRYMLQESVLLHDILDELYSLAFENEEGDDIKDEDRLVAFEEGAKDSAIKAARATLPARRAR